MSRSCRRRSCLRACSTSGACPPTTRAARTTQVLNPLESDRPQLATTLLPGLLEALGAQRIPRCRRRRAVRDRPGRRAHLGNPCRRTHSERPQAHRRGDRRYSTRRCRASRSTSAWCWRACANRRARGVPVGRWRRADAFEAVRVIGRAAGVELTLRAAQYLPWHPGRCAEVLVGDTVVGHAGQLHPAVVERSGLPKGTCAVELDLDAIPLTETLPAPAVSPFPAVFQDVSLIVGEDVAAQTVVDAVRDGAGELLEDVRLFDVYTGPQIGDGPQVADAGAAVPRRRPHADRGRGQRRARRRRRDRRRPRRCAASELTAHRPLFISWRSGQLAGRASAASGGPPTARTP